MRVSAVASLIVGVHVAVIGSVVMTQGCASTRGSAASTEPALVESAPAPVLPPSAALVSPPSVQPVAFPSIQPPAPPAPLKTSVAAENVYVVKAGDSLSKIAAAHGVNSRELAELNQITDPNKIRINQKLILPDYSKPSQSQPAGKSSAKAAAKETAVSGDAYVVKAGDALSKIAALHGVKTKDLMAANNLTDANKIRVGQKLAIPAAKAAGQKEPAQKKEKSEEKPVEKKAKEPAVEPLPAPVPEAAAEVAAPVPAESQEAMLDYTVQDGDTAEGIARLFVVRKDDILRVNNVPAGEDVKPGQKIKIPPSSL
ncbi:MAG: LysM peptidoglycan-binding domain-containing protein [Opitutae bacterium]|nr:LysM peptidoglycan-binding domain-containing protein [Opitutae bacterium]